MPPNAGISVGVQLDQGSIQTPGNLFYPLTNPLHQRCPWRRFLSTGVVGVLDAVLYRATPRDGIGTEHPHDLRSHIRCEQRLPQGVGVRALEEVPDVADPQA